MAYNKAKAEREWRKWKEKDMQVQREAGMSEEHIMQIYQSDWAQFNSDRCYYEKLNEDTAVLETMPATEESRAIKTVDDLLDEIENEDLHKLLRSIDRLTLQIIVWKINHYSSLDISAKCGLTVSAINFRVWHLRKKIKEIFKDI